MAQGLKSFWLALQFFTRWPTPQFAQVTEQDMGRALAWLPIIGLMIGAGLWLLSLVQFALPTSVVALLILAFWVWQTGALHIDGVADFADGWLAGCGNQQRALEVMKDSRIGTGGGVAIALLLLAKWVLLVELLTLDLAVWLVLIPLVARVASLVLMVTTSYASQHGMAESMFRCLNRKWVVFWGLLVVLLLLVLQPGLFVLGLVWWWIRFVIVRTLGGMNGDTAGMMTELIELAMMLGLIALVSLNLAGWASLISSLVN
ncbi:adenosylcobinamide-GDP ribazoletransferase [Thiomicrospira microaerophila]|uniref:adenosylcobinamide-GDP ribazoletransferase n=1 Tax=Thiomicrospira microaerophila TaxID=406020 RepID=UPI00200E2850|nr:adenosylcobinamide-GDP ribazoletransferase [Thiomicrospira microaerophila]UQB41570.1 adenosylcobinamide-GDP ribazoletransferase [Thiomicrospira microaerophila]